MFSSSKLAARLDTALGETKLKSRVSGELFFCVLFEFYKNLVFQNRLFSSGIAYQISGLSILEMG